MDGCRTLLVEEGKALGYIIMSWRMETITPRGMQGGPAVLDWGLSGSSLHPQLKA